MSKAHKMQNQARNRTMDGLDIVTYLKQSQQAQLMQQLLLTKEQRILLRCHSAWTMDDSDSQPEPDGKGLDILVSQVASKNIAVALFALGRLNKLMHPITKRKLSSFDVKLIKKSFLDYIEPVAADRSPRKDRSPVTTRTYAQ